MEFETEYWRRSPPIEIIAHYQAIVSGVFTFAKIVIGQNYLYSFLTIKRDQFVWIEKDRHPVKCNAYAVDQKIVTAWFSGNSLISTEPLLRIS